MRLWLSNQKLCNPLIIPLLLFSVILAVYYPAMLSGIHLIDDPGIISLYSTSPKLLHILKPGNSYYYRPLVELSFWLDNCFWSMEPVVMHLENILLHCVNSVLVFFIARKTINTNTINFASLPVFGALFFALHPVNVEAVAWIAGRTDLLLTMFVLASYYSLLCWLNKPKLLYMFIGLVFLVAAVLTKETAIAAAFAASLLIFKWPGVAKFRERVIPVVILLSFGLLLTGFILVFRDISGGLNKFLSWTDIHIGQVVLESLISIGFYTSKLIVPVPLNFSIISVHSGFALAGLVTFIILFWLLKNNLPSGLLFLSSVLILIPAVLISMMQITWTPFAERYLYLPSALCAVGFSVLFADYLEKFKKIIILFIFIVLPCFFLVSLHRSILWNNKLAFLQDTIAKSPEFGSLYNELGVFLLKKGEIEKANDAFLKADKLNKRSSMELLIKANIISIQYVKNNYLVVREMFFQLFNKKQDAPAVFLELLYKADGKRFNTLNDKDRYALIKDMLETLNLLNQKRPDPFWLYRSGQLCLIAGDKVMAKDFFLRSYLTAPDDAYYRKAAMINLINLEHVK